MRTIYENYYSRVLLVLSLVLPAFTVPATELQGTFESTEIQTSLIELYSSEGCYSCPPADAWLRTLKKDPRLWKEIVPVAFHVDYWDYIGWKDTFATAAFTQRQRNYAALSASRSVYTPEFFIDGNEWRGFFKKKRLPISSENKSGHLTVIVKNDTAEVNFISSTLSTHTYQINIAILGFDLTNNIVAGENAGKTLQHDFVALGHKTEFLLKKIKQTYQITTNLPKFNNPGNRLALAAWVTRRNNPIPIQTVGGWLEIF
ncbi:MAG: DUF1223 domain-containing protein [Gammaproteobacteria bacterium]|nr:DUF1223 domain-containing protein [Gammaproteobacteria bacterium]